MVLHKNSFIQHWLAGLGICATRPFGQGRIVDNLYSSMVNADLCRSQNTRLTYDEMFMEAERQKTQIAVNQLHEKLTYGESIDQNVWVVPARFGAMRYINDERLLSKDKSRELERVRIVPQNIVKLYNTHSPNGPPDLQSHENLAIRSSRITDICGELYKDSSDYYTLNTLVLKLHCMYVLRGSDQF